MDHDIGARKRRQSEVLSSSVSVAKSRHFYSAEQDEFLARKLVAPGMHELLQSARERGQAVPSKERLHQDIAMELNQRFGASVDGPQIKNKIAHMRKLWFAAHDMVSRADRHDEQLKRKILAKCSFYYVLQPITDILLSTAPRKIMDNANNSDDFVEISPSDTDDELMEPSSIDVPGSSQRVCRPEREVKRPRGRRLSVPNALSDAARQQWTIGSEQSNADRDMDANREEIWQVCLQVEKEVTKRIELRLEYHLLEAKERTRQIGLELELEKERVRRLTLERGS